jgi:hypothetical protein
MGKSGTAEQPEDDWNVIEGSAAPSGSAFSASELRETLLTGLSVASANVKKTPNNFNIDALSSLLDLAGKYSDHVSALRELSEEDAVEEAVGLTLVTEDNVQLLRDLVVGKKGPGQP